MPEGLRNGPSVVPVEISVEVRDHSGYLLRRIIISSHSPIPDSVAIAAAIKKEFGARVRHSA